MRQVLLVISSFRWGGTNRALQSMLKQINTKDYEVDIFVTVHSGNYTNSFSNCHIFPENKYLGTMLDQRAFQKGWGKVRFIALRGLNKITKGRFQHWLYWKIGNSLIKDKNYDAVIAWGEGVPTVFVSHINHPNKIGWIHWDYTQYTNGPTERDIYDGFKSIVCVSEYTRKTFLSYYPEMESKVYAINNILDTEEIKALAKEQMDVQYEEGVFNIVSVGRVSDIKRFSKIPEISKKIKDAGCEFHWYIVGPYSDDTEYHKIIDDSEAFGLKDSITLLGGKRNPYPYIANADILVCTSLSESWSYTINEAKVLGIPPVSTDFGAVYESIEDGVTGVISPIEEMHSHIIELIQNRDKYESIQMNIESFAYNNTAIMETINSLINDR